MAVPPIPVQNVYYLLSYAWNALPEADIVDVGRVPSNELADLFAFVLCGGVEHLARRGLERGYLGIEEELASLRGKIRLLESHARMLPQRGVAICETDDLKANTLANQIIRTTLGRLARVSELDPGLRKRTLRLRNSLSGIDDIALDASAFRRVQLHANNRYYRFLLNICRLIHDAKLVDESDGAYRFRDFLRDHQQMSRLFQRFVCNFYRIERNDSSIRAEQIAWRVKTRQESALKHLPRMTTDITVGIGDVKLIIDTKYYHETLSTYYDAESIHSGNLYQLLSYLSNAEPGGYERVEGMLLYPVVSTRLRLLYDELQGFRVRICTVDLANDWQSIRKELLAILEWVATTGGTNVSVGGERFRAVTGADPLEHGDSI
jgi:5-methylcytosine-specific restriction enzyme subunit McrC